MTTPSRFTLYPVAPGARSQFTTMEPHCAVAVTLWGVGGSIEMSDESRSWMR